MTKIQSKDNYRRKNFNFDLTGHLFDHVVSVHACSVTWWSLTLCNPVDCSPPVSFVHVISQARIPKPAAFSSFRASPVSPALAGGFFTTEPSGKPLCVSINYLIGLLLLYFIF